MKKLILLLFIFCLQLVPAKAQWVTIPNSAFANKLTQLFPSCMNGNLMDTTCAGIVNADSLNLSALYISDLSGVEYFDNLTYLEFNHNQISSLPILPALLTELKCTYNSLSYIQTLPASLLILDCSYNQINTIDTFPTTLTNVNCSHNQLSYLPNLPNSLIELNCSYNLLSSLPTLPNSLSTIFCEYNLLSSLPALPVNLIELKCSQNQLFSLPAIPSTLASLICGSNQLINLPSLPVSLTYLACNVNELNSLPPLPSSLITLGCSNNQLSYLPTLPSSLEGLSCEHNQLSSLPALPSSLFSFSCGFNLLTYIPEIPDTMWGFLINNNNISCIANLPHIIAVADISNNSLTCVPNQTYYSLGLPLCMDNDPVNNPNYCTGVANITGYVYTDLDSNCSYSNTDWNTENIPVKVYDSQNNLLAMSYTVNGAYSFTLLQPDTFMVKIDDATLPFSMDCGQVNNQTVPLDSANQTIQNINFPVVCDTAHDIKVNSMNSLGLVFPGQQHTLNTNITNNINWYNLNCSSINYSGTVSINVTGPVTYVSPAPNALTPTINGNTFTYNITDFNTLTTSSFGLQFLTDTTAQAGDLICVHLEIDPTPLDADTTNNVYDFCYQVVNSYDPNMKEVYPVNVLPGYDDWFTYTIHFQNTGNAPAFNIRLRDTLDTNLDLNTFEIRGYSHPAIVSINGNNLTVRFNNIMLPDSTTDYEGSMGYFQYRIKPLPNLPLGTQIENTAYIYFDYNAPIVTNTTQNNFQMVVSTINGNDDANQLKVFPNPANEMLNINLQNNNIENCIITNALGQTVYNSANEINGNHKIQLNIADLNAGVYFVKVRSDNGSYTAKFIKSE